MQELKVIGVESGALLAASDDGDRFRIAIDEVLQSRLRQRIPESAESRKLSPREIQAHIRSGMSAEDVVRLTGASLEYVQRFEGAILAERDYIVTSALSVPVRTAADVDPLEGGSGFGGVIRERLASLSAKGERWTSWKEDDGDWIVKLSFTLDDIDHDARWAFDPKKQLLSPLNTEATTLSQHGEAPTQLIPRLRAVGQEPGSIDQSRFDSGAFSFISRETMAETAPFLEPVPYGRIGSEGARNSVPDAAAQAAINRADEQPSDGTSQTADLLDALRRRRGEREAGGFGEQDPARHHPSNSQRPTEVPLDTFDEPRSKQEHASVHPMPSAQQRSGKKGRATMPSWDEIVFGARTDDDPA